ncbi:unnamed protein product [Cunninghamella blakesleeana]
MRFTSSFLVLASCLALVQAAPMLPNESEISNLNTPSSAVLRRRGPGNGSECFFYCGGGAGGFLGGLFGGSTGSSGSQGPTVVYTSPQSGDDDDEDNGDYADEHTK